MNTFANQLRLFARSVDIVDDEIFDRVRSLVYKYVKSELGAAYFELMREEPLDRQLGLKMFWSSEDRDHFWRVSRDDGSYCNLVTQAFAEERPMWIVDRDRKPLSESGALEDEWSGHTDLLPYEQSGVESIHTLVILPLRRKRPLGVFYFESSSHIGITDVAKGELQVLADAVGIFLELYELNRSQSRMTSAAIFELQESLEAAKFPKLTRPHFFVAFSHRADDHVTTVISEVLDLFSDRIEFTDWSRMTESGNISTQIVKEITRSRFGICYLSEPNEREGDHPASYRDNPNVVFEAGMLHARTAANDSGDVGEPAGWIPMREKDSPAAPFDFAAERTLQIPRRSDGTLNEERLRSQLSERISKLLGEA